MQLDDPHASSLATSPHPAHRTFDLEMLANQPVREVEGRRVKNLVYYWGTRSNFHKLLVRLILWGPTLRRALVATLIILLILGGVIIAANRIPPAAATALFIIAGVTAIVVAVLVFIWPRPPKE